ncbi:MAG: hypothetical protein JRF33_18925 [Deltaproteobacteria bacterium]|nr:hypothetical protein [Deltaproteobacteria bacterium]
MRALIIVGAVAVAAMGIMLFLVISDTPDTVSEVAPERPSTLRDSVRSDRKVSRRRARLDGGVVSKFKKRGRIEKVMDENTIHSFGQEFESKWYEDRKKLGLARHKEMEKLWFDGRRPRGDEESIAKLEKLIDEFGDTNRAGCAAMELGHHYIRQRGLSLDDRRKKAKKYWHLAEQRYGDGLCEYNAPTAGMSKLALVTWVYRYTDPGMAQRMLQEIIDKHQGETDHLGQPLSDSARRLMGSIK